MRGYMSQPPLIFSECKSVKGWIRAFGFGQGDPMFFF